MKAPDFRFWDLENEYYLNPVVIDICDRKIYRRAILNNHSIQIDITNSTVPEMQSPYPDIDGDPIYDGDLVRISNILDGYVTYESGLFHIVTDSAEGYILLCDNYLDCKKIGNIHEDMYLALFSDEVLDV